MKIEDISAVILAGGKNSRINQEKSLIKIRGIHLIDKQVKLLGSIFEDIMIVTGKENIKQKFPHLHIIEDEFVNCGPLAGIHAAMKHTSRNSIFVFACDMPNLNRSLILHQAGIYMRDKAKILVPRHKDGIEPLHAIYSITNLKYLEECLQMRRNSVRSFYSRSKISYLDLDSSSIKYFFNINTHLDLEQIV